MEEDRRFYVYEYYIVPTGEIFYVGKGTKNRYKTLTNRNKFFTCMYKSHDCAVRIILDELTEEEAYFFEYDRIFYLRTHTNYRLTNQTDGGDGARGLKISDETRVKMAEASKKMWEDQEFRDRMIAMRKDENGPYKSDAFRKKISDLVKGENNPNYDHHWSQELKESLSKTCIETGCHKGLRNGRCKKIQCVETGEVFDYIDLAREKYSDKMKSASSISIALDKPTRSAAGLHWITVKDE